MVTTFDKAIVAVLSGLFFFLGQFFGIGFFADMSPETFTAIAGAVTTVLVWLVPAMPCGSPRSAHGPTTPAW